MTRIIAKLQRMELNYMTLFFTALFFMQGVGFILAGIMLFFNGKFIAGPISAIIGYGLCRTVVYLTS
ncbi:hypothetical protein ACTTAL_06400 [Rhodobacter capsulatus]|uniref:hypothetical protein n=1 Tax=Rhodobacter capsulatus TaxID=1061 RepID=UPI001038F69B|nr:hypothetical protein [Rhodobacter capsulatus]